MATRRVPAPRIGGEGIPVGEFEQRQLKAIRDELNRAQRPSPRCSTACSITLMCSRVGRRAGVPVFRVSVPHRERDDLDDATRSAS